MYEVSENGLRLSIDYDEYPINPREEYSSLGIEKPEGYYGYFTDVTLRQIKEDQSLKKTAM